jgi:V/A-type H+-transporting ATPase subunit I
VPNEPAEGVTQYGHRTAGESDPVRGPTEAKAPVLDELQRLGCAHLVALSSETGEDSVSAAGSEDARRALKYLRSSPIQRRPSRDAAAFQCAEVVSGAMALQRSHEALEDERDEVRRLVRDLEPWGDFVVPQPEELAGLNLWFYRLPRRRTEQLRDTDLVWQVVGGDGQMDNVVVVADREIDELAETPIDLDPRGLTVLRRRLAEIDEAIEEVTWKRAELTRWVRLLELIWMRPTTRRPIARLRRALWTPSRCSRCRPGSAAMKSRPWKP